MRYEIRPLGAWTGPVTVDRARSGRFRARWDDTLKLLQREVDMLGGTLLVVQVDVTEGELRRDGMLRTHAKVGFPGVRVSFDSQHGRLSYATDAYDRWMGSDPPGWQANVRAIALALGALRAVDRYGVTRRGEQYVGWQALPAAPPDPNAMTVEQAAQWLVDQAGEVADAFGHSTAQVIADREALGRVFRAAVYRHHPDRGGDPDLFRRCTAARDVIGVGHG
jgi:hypothetical protein